jgi:hypothetical protein
MAGLAWTIFLVGLVLAVDDGWTRYRDWRGRRLALKHGRTLTQKFTLLHH